MEKLGDDQIRDLSVDRGAEKDDSLVQQARVDVERALASRGLLDDHGDQRAHAGSLLAGVQSFVSVGAVSLSGVQSLSRACARSGEIRFTSETIRSRVSFSRRSARSVSNRPASRSLAMTSS